MAKNIKYSMLESILENVAEIEKELGSLKETTKVEGEGLENDIRRIELNGVFNGLVNKLNTIRQYSQAVIEIDQFEDDLYKKPKE